MHTPSTLWGREPALIVAAIQAVLALAIGFGLPVSPEQLALIVAAMTAVLGVLVRSQVTPAAALPPEGHDPIPGTTLPDDTVERGLP